MLKNILKYNDDLLESSHNIIQRIFPLIEKSRAQPSSPTISQEEVNKIKYDVVARDGIFSCFKRMMDFYGFDVFEKKNDDNYIDIYVFRQDDLWEEKSKRWISPRNHNFLRLTRIIKSLKLFGNNSLAQSLYDQLEYLYNENNDYKRIIGETTFNFWKEAIES